MKCPVCDSLNTSMLCPRCGFDVSRDYTRYPTFGIVPSAATASSLRREREAGRRAADPEKQQLLDRVAELEKQLRFMTATTQQLMEKLDAPAPRTDKPVPPPAPTPAKPASSKKRNRLRKNTPRFLFSSTVFGSELRRDKITSVTFLDTLADAPADAWDVSADKSGSVLAWAVPSGELYNLYLAANGEIEAPASCNALFAGYRYMRRIHFGNCFNTSNVQSMKDMFSNCSSLRALDLSSFDTSKVRDMSNMFNNCKSLTTLKRGPRFVTDGAKTDGMYNKCAINKKWWDFIR